MTTRSKVRFKEITSQQSVLFPSNISERIEANHPVRVVNQIVDELNIGDILSTYKGGGTSSYHPRVMLKILFYSYVNNIYSCRKIAQQLKENIYYMWISGNSTPNFRTINDFRGKKLKGKIQLIFTEFVRLMAELGYVSLEIQYVDGTKVEAVSNRYSFVWRSNAERHKGNLEVKIAAILSEIDSTISMDDNESEEDQGSLSIGSEVLSEKIKELNTRLDELTQNQKKQVRKLEKEHLPRLKKYEQQLDILEDRNSYSKTDTDATFMRMKEDHMGNGQLKPAYNIQISTENQLVTNFSMHRRPGDTATLISHLEQFEQAHSKQSHKVVADAGYGSEQNYQYAEDKGIEAFIKYNYFHKEQRDSYKNDPFLPANLYYNKQQNFIVCPMGQRMNFIGINSRKSDLGFEYQVSAYQAQNCHGCNMRSQCHKSEGNRMIELNHNLIGLRHKAREKLRSEEGLYHRSMRPIEPEAVFGQIKFNNKFTRFTLRGLKKVEVEFGLIAISHNLRKMAQIMSKNLIFNGYQHFYRCFQQFFGLIWLSFSQIETFYIFFDSQSVKVKIAA